MVKRILSGLCLIMACLTASAQQSLNLYTTTQGIVGFTFEETPRISFPEPEVVKVECERITVEFPFAEVEKITFEDGATAIETITVREKNAQVTIYDVAGRMVRSYARTSESTGINLSSLPAGTYVVNDGKRTFKVMKR